ncbi:MAG: hypothetical protein AB7N71_09935 [Phycisphaerae bacterium]
MRKIPYLLIATLCAATALAQTNDRDDRDPMENLPDEFYFTKGMVNWFVTEFSNKMGEQLNMDQEQIELTRENFRESLPRWFSEQRKDLQPVMNEFLEMWAKNEAPTPEQVSEWSERALPAFDSFTNMLVETSEATRGYLTEEQNTILDGNIAAFNVGTSYARARLQEWQEGGFDAEVHWHRAPGHQQAVREEQKLIHAEEEYARQVAEGKNPDPPEHWVNDGAGGTNAAGNAVAGANKGARSAPANNATPRAPAAAAKAVDEMEQYTAAFCQRYELDQAQHAKAYQFLKDAQEQRDRWQTRIAEREVKLNEMIARASTDGGRQAAQQKLDKIREPFARHFDKLKERLEKLPTAQQRANAAPAPAAVAAPADGTKVAERR